MRVALIGATGNVGTSLLDMLADEPDVDEIVGIARRTPAEPWRKVRWASADIRAADLADLLRGADAVVHLAWAIQPSHDLKALRSTNVDGTRRVLRAVLDAHVPALVYASSVGAYAPGDKDRLVDESWPVTGIRSSFYSRHKAETEAMLDDFARANPQVRVARLRPSLIFKRYAGAEIAGLFLGPVLGRALARPSLIKLVPRHPRLVFQAVHSLDVADAYRRAVMSDAAGAFNVTADPVIDPHTLADLFCARTVHVPERMMRAATWATWKTRLQPTPPGWVDMGLHVPLMDAGRIRRELGWAPALTATAALRELVEGIARRETTPTPAMAGLAR